MPNSACRKMASGAGRAVFGIVVGAGVVGAAAAPAAAHTALEASSPQHGGRLGASPPQIMLDFTGPLRPGVAELVIHGPDGLLVTPEPLRVTSDKMAQPLRPLGRAGDYRVEYRVVARDGHPLTGTIRFTLTRGAPAAGSHKTPGTSTTAPAPDTAGSAALPPAGGGTGSYARTATGGSGGPGLPPWAFGIGTAAAVAFVNGAVWFGRWVTRDAD